MPNLVGHIGLALEALPLLNHPALEEHQGAFLLGSTAPDIRAMTKWPRERTHFAPLSAPDVLAGVRGLFRAHPDLREASRLAPPTRAFVAGYLSHLVLDQAWVVWVYRPFFGNPVVYGDEAEGNIADRALQLQIDSQVEPLAKRARPLLEGAEEGVAVPFIPPDVLGEWRRWVQTMLERDFTWERLRFMARRQYPQGRPGVAEMVDSFLENVEAGLARIYRRVPPSCLEEFRRRGLECFAGIAREYLACALSTV